ncbi:hypothetical protein [Streptomyces virginiae]|uniref:hypothetical protein n=1 Tax=Streptomyces virginiae TaxID=1961 RepID=UPI002E2C27E4|nr:hypothetical protein [Streptomyces virginiae]
MDPWGPDGVRYVCFLFWDHHGYRHLTNQIAGETWSRWHHSSGEFWDLFLAGCYAYGSDGYYGDRGLPLTPEQEYRSDWRTSGGHDYPQMLWSQRQSNKLARELRAEARRAGAPARDPAGPLELVAVGARRNGDEVDFDWASLRSAAISTSALGAAVSDYTEAHISGDADLVPDDFPVPGSFEDRLPGEIWRDVVKHVGLLKFLFHG